ncbi:RNA polymerase sigma factor [Microbacterium sp. NPDC057944]|uniref:RNA polymerase sigma factor n=1 Tax=Microbacterium sp. NPDC057944 TaxID=3346286 RepID=UPI0036DC5554
MIVFSELWSRYHRLAYVVALRTTARFEPEDLVAEAYARILHALRRGNGPRDHFAAYLATTVRTVAAKWSRHAPEVTNADLGALEHPTDAALDLDPASIVGVFTDPRLELAFRSLPPRWQQILWLNAVEDTPISELASAFRVKPAAVAALAYRARRGLTKEWERLPA